MIIAALIFLIIFFSFILIKSADLIVITLKRISVSLKSSTFFLSAILIALGTSFPEISIAITSSLDKNPSLSLGNVLGANIANISLVAGLAAVTVGRVKVHPNFLKRDVIIAFIAGVLPLVLASDHYLSQVDGLVLLAIYAAYATSFFKIRFLEIAREMETGTFFHKFFRRFTLLDGSRPIEFGKLFISVAVLLFSANIIVKLTLELANQTHVPIFLIGLILLSLGTTLPELAFSFRSIQDKEPTMFFGGILGSIIANSTLIVGLAATIYPITIVSFSEYVAAGIAFLIAFAAFYLFIRSKHYLERWEAALLLLIYIAFVAIEMWLGR